MLLCGVEVAGHQPCCRSVLTCHSVSVEPRGCNARQALQGTGTALNGRGEAREKRRPCLGCWKRLVILLEHTICTGTSVHEALQVTEIHSRNGRAGINQGVILGNPSFCFDCKFPSSLRVKLVPCPSAYLPTRYLYANRKAAAPEGASLSHTFFRLGDFFADAKQRQEGRQALSFLQMMTLSCSLPSSST